jgi:hypothetical protein
MTLQSWPCRVSTTTGRRKVLLSTEKVSPEPQPRAASAGGTSVVCAHSRKSTQNRQGRHGPS